MGSSVKPLFYIVIDAFLTRLNSSDGVELALSKLRAMLDTNLLENSTPAPTLDVIELFISLTRLLNHPSSDVRQVIKELLEEIPGLLTISTRTPMKHTDALYPRYMGRIAVLNRMKRSQDELIRDLADFSLEKLRCISLEEAIADKILSQNQIERYKEHLPVLLTDAGIHFLRNDFLKSIESASWFHNEQNFTSLALQALLSSQTTIQRFEHLCTQRTQDIPEFISSQKKIKDFIEKSAENKFDFLVEAKLIQVDGNTLVFNCSARTFPGFLEGEDLNNSIFIDILSHSNGVGINTVRFKFDQTRYGESIGYQKIPTEIIKRLKAHGAHIRSIQMEMPQNPKKADYYSTHAVNAGICLAKNGENLQEINVRANTTGANSFADSIGKLAPGKLLRFSIAPIEQWSSPDTINQKIAAINGVIRVKGNTL